MNNGRIIIIACFGFSAVVLGAWGAHGLKPHLSPDETQWFETANRYHFYHTLAMLCVAVMAAKPGSRWIRFSFIAFLTGILFFSGSLYLMAAAGWRFLGPLTPMGGVALLAGWAMLAVAIIRK